MSGESLQDAYAPRSACFGCGPANSRGLRIKSRLDGDEVVCDWTPEEQFQAFEGFMNGGIAGTIMDCNSNWAAAYAIMKRRGDSELPSTVTAEFRLRFMKPTPMRAPLHLRSRVLDLGSDRATVETTLEAAGDTTAVFRGMFVAVSEGHPAFGRWR